jgi:hypothetical protein
MIYVGNTTPLLTHGLREQRKGEEFISRTPQLQQETRVADLSPSSMTGNNFQSTGLVRDEDTGIQLARTDQRGYFYPLSIHPEDRLQWTLFFYTLYSIKFYTDHSPSSFS